MKYIINRVFDNNRKSKIIILVVSVIISMLLSYILFKVSILIGKEYNYNYSKIGTTEYKVYLKENYFYEEEYIDENMQYVSGLIDYIDIDFDYKFRSELNIDYLYNYDVNAKIVISEKNSNNKIIYKKDDVLLKKNDKVINNINTNNINENIKINFEKYKAIYESFRKEYGLSVDGYLIVSLNVKEKQMNIEHFKDIQEEDSVSIKIPLSLSTIDITKNNLNKSNEIHVTDKMEIINKFYFIVFILSVFVLFSLIILLIILIREMIINSKSPYERNLKKILKEYDRAIVESRKGIYDLKKYKIIEVNDFQELLDARDNLNNPIIYININTGKESWFVLLHDDLAYRYILK